MILALLTEEELELLLHLLLKGKEDPRRKIAPDVPVRMRKYAAIR